MREGTELFSMVNGRKSDAKLHAELLGDDVNTADMNRRAKASAIKRGATAEQAEAWFGKD